MKDDVFWMQQALVLAQKAAEQDEVPVGAVLVYKNEILASGHNLLIQNNDPTAHAEILALRQACSALENYRLPEGTSIYVSLEPCIMCMGALIQARVDRLVFGAYDAKTGAAESQYRIGEDSKLNHNIDILGGILLEPCSQLLKEFFRAKRKKRKNSPL